VSFTARLRVSGRAPELWDSEHGRTTPLGQWSDERGVTSVPMHLDADGSAFLLFATPAAGLPVAGSIRPETADVAIERRGRVLSLSSTTAGSWTVETRCGSRRVALPVVPQPREVSGPWLVRFADRLTSAKTIRLAALASWTEQADPDIRLYSGLATYSTMLWSRRPAPDERLLLDLGVVASLAAVRIDGVEVARLFKPPFIIDVTDQMRAGRVRLEVDVANSWRNRIIGDDGKSEADRVSFVVPMLRKGKPWLPGSDAKLEPAGLLGPVRVVTRKAVDIPCRD
jgi:hypothetical protein